MECTCCKQKFEMQDILFAECGDFISKKCVAEILKKGVSNAGCPVKGCGYQYSELELKEAIGEDAFNKLNESIMNQMTGSIVECVKCKMAFNFEPGSMNAIVKDNNNQLLKGTLLLLILL